MTVASPCTSVCRMNAGNGLCEGCFRTIDEIAAWSGMDEAAKGHVLHQIPRRKHLLCGVVAEVPDGAANDGALLDRT